MREERIELEAAHTTMDFKMQKRLLGAVLSRTIRSSGIPANWLAAEIVAFRQESGVRMQLQITVVHDEPRLLTYLSALQAEFTRRLFAIEEYAQQWFDGITWRVTCEPLFEPAIPGAEYWEAVENDRVAYAHAQSGAAVDRPTLERYFGETAPADLVVDFTAQDIVTEG
jgi:hypothetical protein